MTMICPNSNQSGLKSFSPWVFVTYGCSCRCEYCVKFDDEIANWMELNNIGMQVSLDDLVNGKPLQNGQSSSEMVLGLCRGGCRATHRDEEINGAVR